MRMHDYAEMVEPRERERNLLERVSVLEEEQKQILARLRDHYDRIVTLERIVGCERAETAG